VVPTTYALTLATAAPQPFCNQSVTHSFYLDGGYTPLCAAPRQRSSRMHIPCSLSPLFSISCALFCTFLRSPKTQRFYFQAIPHSASKKLNHRAWGRGQFASGKYGKSFRRYIFTSLHPCFLFREETASARRADYRDGLEFRVLPPSGSGTFTFDPFKMLMSCRALTTDLP